MEGNATVKTFIGTNIFFNFISLVRKKLFPPSHHPPKFVQRARIELTDPRTEGDNAINCATQTDRIMEKN